jgi:uracil-DNA glycosylase family 4
VDRRAALERIKSTMESTKVTPVLRSQATQIVFGTGNPDASIVIIGEAPGKQEDLSGQPFIGAAGKFLDTMLASIQLSRLDIYITNIVKYRPPNNRDPTREEVAASIPYLELQLQIIEPKLVISLGRHAMGAFFPNLKIGDAHGKLMYLDNKAFLPLFHPAAALYNGGLRQTMMSDFALIPQHLAQID